MLELFAHNDNLIKRFEEEIQRATVLKTLYGNWVRENPVSPYRLLVEQFAQEQQQIINGLTLGIKNMKDHGYK